MFSKQTEFPALFPDSGGMTPLFLPLAKANGNELFFLKLLICHPGVPLAGIQSFLKNLNRRFH